MQKSRAAIHKKRVQKHFPSARAATVSRNLNNTYVHFHPIGHKSKCMHSALTHEVRFLVQKMNGFEGDPTQFLEDVMKLILTGCAKTITHYLHRVHDLQRAQTCF